MNESDDPRKSTDAKTIKAATPDWDDDELVRQYKRLRRLGLFEAAGYCGLELGARIGLEESQRRCLH